MTSDQTAKPDYDPMQYWATREHPNTAEAPGIGPQDEAYLRPRLQGISSVLEIGPGVGRLFPLYAGIPRVCTLDISRNYRDRTAAAAAASGISVDARYLDRADAPFPFADGEIDVGVFSQVLQHVPFELVEHTMAEAARCCRKVVVLTAFHRAWPTKGTDFQPYWHCFAHDYPAICEAIGCSYDDHVDNRPGEPERGHCFSFARRT